MHSYFLSAAAVFICMCKRVRVCLPVCLIRPCVYLFMNSDGVFVCTVPLFQQKMRRHLVGDSELAVKKRERKCGGRRRKKKRKEKKNPGSPEIYLFWLPASLKLPVGDFKMAPLPATEWALPCQNVFEWKTQAEKFPPFLSLPRCFFLSCSLVLSSSTSLPPFCPSFSAHRKGISSSPVELPLNAAFSLFLCVSLFPSRWNTARALCLSEVSASHSEVHSSLKHDVYLLGPVCETVQVLVPLSEAIMICVSWRNCK